MLPEHLPEATPPGRRKKIVAPLVLIVAVAAIIAGTVSLAGGASTGSQATGPPAAAGEVRADVGNAPPRSLIAAGRVAVSAYWTGVWEERGKVEHQLTRGTLTTTVKRLTRTWHVYNPRSAVYEQTPWSWVDVAPGLRKAAVLEGELPSKRLGIVDLSTREVLSWIDLPRGAASAAWSSDGRHILATSYDRHPDEVEFVSANSRFAAHGQSPRSGFFVVDAATATARFHPVGREERGSTPARNDFRWVSPDLVSSTSPRPSDAKRYFGLSGESRGLPADLAGLSEDEVGRAGLSPDGKLLAGPAGLPTKVVDRATGQVAGTQQVLDLLAWADNRRLIALGCAGACEDEFRNALVLVSVDGEEVTRLSSYREDGGSDDTWHPVLTLR